ncbi:MAG: phytanoyl-CoA dioxygenase family protein [Acidimicrobiia bacterium]|nr:phytanoyl-CoA dioxygenase family protein [Acidimicrobiia bacterium]
MSPLVLNGDDVDRFRIDGVVCVRGAVGPELVARMTAAVDAVIAEPTRFGGVITEPDKPGMFFQDRYLFPTNPTFRAFLHETPLAGLAAQATGSTTIRAFYDHIFVKDPGTEENFVWHQDRPYWPVDGSQICSTWLALTAADVESSALEFVRGSHRWDRTFRPEYPALEGRSPDEVEAALWRGLAEHIRSFDDVCPAFEEHPDIYDVVGFAVEPGDVLLFDYRTVHRSGPNSGASRRVAISWRWLGDDAIWAPKPGADPIVKPADTALRPGDLITDDDVFPIAYAG